MVLENWIERSAGSYIHPCIGLLIDELHKVGTVFLDLALGFSREDLSPLVGRSVCCAHEILVSALICSPRT